MALPVWLRTTKDTNHTKIEQRVIEPLMDTNGVLRMIQNHETHERHENRAEGY